MAEKKATPAPAEAEVSEEVKPPKQKSVKAAAKATEPVAEVTASAAKTHVLKLHHLRPAPGAKKAKIRVGRGEASKGKTAGRGTKGTKARHNVPARLEGGQMPLHMRLPKKRGFKNPFRTEYQVVNLARLAELFPQGGAVGVEDLVEAGAVRKRQLVKVLGDGDLAIKFDLTVDAWSISAKDKIEAAGGTITALATTTH